MSDFGNYDGIEFLGLKLQKRDFLVNQLLREKDSVLLIGGEKAGKTLLMQQLVCTLTTGDHPFLDEYDVAKACKVSYVQVEGELSDTQDRYKRMIQAVDFRPENFQLLFMPPLGLDVDVNCNRLIEEVEKVHCPDVLILDPLYFCFNGSLSDDDRVRRFLGNVRRIKDLFGCAVIIVHHTHKIRFNNDGKPLDEGDDAVFGSSALKWWPDHLFFFTYNKKRNIREFRCNTQRSGDILEKLELVLEQPEPLYFRPAEMKDTAKGANIAGAIKAGNYTRADICRAIGISKATFYHDVKVLLKDRIVTKNDEHRPVSYGLAQP